MVLSSMQGYEIERLEFFAHGFLKSFEEKDRLKGAT